MKKNLSLIMFWLVFSAFLLTILSLFVTAGTRLLMTNPYAMDFLPFYTGAVLLSQSPKELYQITAQAKLQSQIAPITNTLDIFAPFVNPPFVGLLLSPLAKFPLQSAYTILVAVNMIIMFIFCFLSLKQFPGAVLYEKVLLIIASATFLPILTALLIGQLSFVMLLIFFLVWIFLKKGWQFRGGLLLSLILIKPHFILVPLVAILLQRKLKLIVGLVTGCIFLAVVSLFMVGPQGIANYYSLLVSSSQLNNGYGVDLFAQHSLQTFLLIVSDATRLSDIRLVWFICLAIILLPTLFIWLRKYPFHSSEFALQWALLILATLLTSPHTHFHDLTLLLVVGITIAYALVNKKTAYKNSFILLLPLGYFIALSGYLLELYLHASRQGWIIVSVIYIFVLWSMVIGALVKTSKKSRTI